MIETSFENSQSQNFELFQKQGGAFIRVCAFIRHNPVYTNGQIYLTKPTAQPIKEKESVSYRAFRHSSGLVQ